MSASSAVADDFNKALDDIEERITAGGQRLNNVFDELKQLQQRYRTARLSNEHRNQIWDRIDGAFKKAKERKFGAGAADEGNAVERRLAGLVDALKRMEDSVRRDAEELEFQHKKVSKTEGQLEAQIRMAKIKMIEERLESKRAKVEEIKRTMSDLERRSNSAKNKEAKRVEKEAERQKVAAAKDAVKAEIDAEIKTRKEDSLFEAASTMLGDVLMDAIDTAKAVASVTADQVEDAVDVAKDKGADLLEEAAEKGSSLLEKAKELAGIVAEEAEKAFENAVDSVEDVISANSDPEKSAKKGKKATNDTVIVEDTVHTPAPVKENETAADPTKEADQKGATPGE